MKQLTLTLLLSVALLAGCSSPTTDAKKKEEQTGQTQVAENVAPKAEPQQADKERLPQPPPVQADAMSTRAAGAPMKTSGAIGRTVAREAMPASAPVPTWNRESYNANQENGFINAGRDPLSTFSIDVDTASYANVRRFVNGGNLPPVGAVRIEEMINYFSYDYPAPTGSELFALSAEVGPSPFHSGYQLARIGLKARDLVKEQLPPSNLVFLIDVSGSMQDANKLPLLKQALPLLVRQLGARDRVAMVVYAGGDSVVLPPTPGNRQQEILAAIDRLRAGGSTHASGGLRTAYQLARQGFMAKGNNRVILASDGDFNVGVTSRDELQRLIEQERQGGIYLTVLGFGMGNYHDDTMEILADKGNGNYAYIDTLLEAKKVMVKEMSGTLFALANDVKIQVEFNPARVGAYRLIGYENRALADEDFRDDSKDAGEIGVGHRVTALYELIPADHEAIPLLDPLKYQAVQPAPDRGAKEWMTVKLRYKPLREHSSRLMSLPVSEVATKQTTADFRFAAAVAGYGMLLTHSEHLGSFSWEQCLEMARSGRGFDVEGYRAEFYRLVEASQLLARQQGEPDGRPEPQPSPHPVLR
ncbi:VWA domain-containing protein [uncultured Desulfobulbus sp.]|uniref:vWA domain-containing protein n=1 Tax=uncultured Desulfobulbus sp. TaxID=239745 RepID=UPI0029C97C71|nr:VWA domain-containing protein [uncultured Desulfobulbus sp.]